MEIEPAPWTPPEVRPDLEPWAPYYGLRFSSPVRWGITCALLVAVLIWVAVAAVQLVLGEGRLRAVGVIMLMPMVVAAPLAMRVLRELWRPHR
jgi:hypothetical protein